MFEHAADGVVDERLAVDLVDVTAIDVLDGVDEEAVEFSVFVFLRRAAVAACQQATAAKQAASVMKWLFRSILADSWLPKEG